MAVDQRSIHFGGVQLPTLPAGEASVAARVVALSRASLSARLKHGVPMADLLDHFITLSHAEARLLHEDALLQRRYHEARFRLEGGA